MERWTRLRAMAHAHTKKLAWLPPLFARLTLGYLFVHSGLYKLGHLDEVTGFFTRLMIPAPAVHARFVGVTELVCGAAVLLGAATRLAVVPLAATMVVALITAKRGDIHEASDLLLAGEYLNLILFAWLAIAGAGPVSIDRIIARRLDGEKKS